MAPSTGTASSLGQVATASDVLSPVRDRGGFPKPAVKGLFARLAKGLWDARPRIVTDGLMASQSVEPGVADLWSAPGSTLAGHIARDGSLAVASWQ